MIEELKCTYSYNPSLTAIKVNVENNLGVNIPSLFYMIYFKIPIEQNHSNYTKFKDFLKDREREKGFIEYIDIQFQVLLKSKKYENKRGMLLSLNKDINPLLNPKSELNKKIIEFFYEELNRKCQEQI